MAVYLDLPKVSVRPSGCLRQGWFAFLPECLTLRAAYAAYRATALLLGSRPAPAGTCSALRISLCTAEGCHGYNKFSPWLCASVRAPSLFLPFAGPKPQKNLTPAIEQIPPTTVGGTPTLLEPTSAPLRVASFASAHVALRAALRQATQPAPAGMCLREIPFSPIRGDLRHSRAPSSPPGLRFAQSVPLRGARTSFSSPTHISESASRIAWRRGWD